MKMIETAIADLLILEPQVLEDERGFFLETWNTGTFSQIGLDRDWAQDNHSQSRKGVLRGLHFQRKNPQGKLVRITRGAVFDVAVDLRRDSPHFGHWVGTELSAKNKRMMWVPEGFAHGFLSLSEGTDCVYKCTGLYDPQDEHSLAWDDPKVGVEWPQLGHHPLLSEKDARGLSLADIGFF